VLQETELIERAKGGSIRAFTKLVEAYRERLFRFLLTRCQSHADAEDALQETFVNAYRYLYSYRAEWRFSTWIYRIAIRNAMSQRPVEVREAPDLADDGNGPLEACIGEQSRRNIWLAAKRVLNEDTYTAMWLRYVEDMSINDIAVALERTESWAKVNLLRGRKALAAEITRVDAAHPEDIACG